jgi:hypothetical protein
VAEERQGVEHLNADLNIVIDELAEAEVCVCVGVIGVCVWLYIPLLTLHTNTYIYPHTQITYIYTHMIYIYANQTAAKK